jgi:hypothetical protein
LSQDPARVFVSHRQSFPSQSCRCGAYRRRRRNPALPHPPYWNSKRHHSHCGPLSWSWKFNVALPLCSNGSCCSERRPISGFVSTEASGFGRRSSSASRFDMAFSQPSPLLWYSVRIVFASDCRTAADHSCGGPSTTPAHERHTISESVNLCHVSSSLRQSRATRGKLSAELG